MPGLRLTWLRELRPKAFAWVPADGAGKGVSSLALTNGGNSKKSVVVFPLELKGVQFHKRREHVRYQII